MVKSHGGVRKFITCVAEYPKSVGKVRGRNSRLKRLSFLMLMPRGLGVQWAADAETTVSEAVTQLDWPVALTNDLR